MIGWAGPGADLLRRARRLRGPFLRPAGRERGGRGRCRARRSAGARRGRPPAPPDWPAGASPRRRHRRRDRVDDLEAMHVPGMGRRSSARTGLRRVAALARAFDVRRRAGRFASWFLKMMIVRFFAPADSRRICAAARTDWLAAEDAGAAGPARRGRGADGPRASSPAADNDARYRDDERMTVPRMRTRRERPPP